jgi:hypothetical protein
MKLFDSVIPEQSGIQKYGLAEKSWIPAYAGMTTESEAS